MGDREIDTSELKKIAVHIDKKHQKSRIKGNKILIACVGSIGKVALVNDSHIGMNIVRAVTRMPLPNEIDRGYVFRYLQSFYTQDYFLWKTRTVSQPTLNVGLISETPILIPDDNTQQDYLAIAQQVSIVKEKSKSFLQECNNSFNALSQKAFAGEL